MLSVEPARTPMRRRSSAGPLVLAVLLAAPAASAQGGLTATPNPYDNAQGTGLVIRNATAGPVALDSLRMASTEFGNSNVSQIGLSYLGYFGSEVVEGRVLCESFSPGPCFESGLFGRVLTPVDSVAVLRFESYCAVCLASGGGGATDTLRIYSGGSAVPFDVEILNVMSVASEAPPAGSGLSLALSPNPARDVSTLALAVPEGGAARVMAYDALGREVAVLHDGPAAETLSLRVDTSGWPVGVYVVRAEAGDRTATARLVVAR